MPCPGHARAVRAHPRSPSAALAQACRHCTIVDARSMVSGGAAAAMAPARRSSPALLLATACLLHAAAEVTAKGLPSWTGVSDSGALTPCLLALALPRAAPALGLPAIALLLAAHGSGMLANAAYMTPAAVASASLISCQPRTGIRFASRASKLMALLQHHAFQERVRQSLICLQQLMDFPRSGHGHGPTRTRAGGCRRLPCSRALQCR